MDIKPTIPSAGSAAPDAVATPTIQISVKDQHDQVKFKVKPTTRMEKVFEAYSKRKGIPVQSLRFLFDGARISGDDTPEKLGLEEGDQIDCMLEQIGGW